MIDDPGTITAVQHLGERLRAEDFESPYPESPLDTELGRWVRREPAAPEVALDMMGGLAGLRACLGSGAVLADRDGNLRLAFSVMARAGGFGIIPGPEARTDRVYAGPDTWILLDKAWRFGLGGRRALELGTGSGMVGSFLTSRYDHVTVTDVTTDSVAAASLARELLEPPRRSHMSVVRADVGHGLAAGAFDFVIGNAPWVPSVAANGEVFADGGPTGCELPLRFLSEGIELLSPHGVLVLLCADVRFSDGRAPLADALSHYRARGFATEIEGTPNPESMSFIGRDDVAPLRGLVSGEHIAVIVYRPSIIHTP